MKMIGNTFRLRHWSAILETLSSLPKGMELAFLSFYLSFVPRTSAGMPTVHEVSWP